MSIKRVLCVCMGNSDRSPLMAATLRMFLHQAGIKDVVVESAGILDIAANGGPASDCGKRIGRRLAFNSVCEHTRRQLTEDMVSKYDLFVCVSQDVAGQVLDMEAAKEQIVNVQVNDPWPSVWQEDHDVTYEDILGKTYKVFRRYFCKE